MTQPPEMPLNIENSSLEMQEFYTAAEIADLKLPGVPSTPQSVTRKAKTDSWHDQKNMAGTSLVRRRSGRGGGWKYHYTLLPVIARRELISRAFENGVSNGSLSDEDRQYHKLMADWYRAGKVARQRFCGWLFLEGASS